MFALIFRSAFGLEAGFGAVLGPGDRSGASSAASTPTRPDRAPARTRPRPPRSSHPAKQGYVQAFSVYVDTLLVCSATAFLILSTGMYNVQGAGRGD